MGELTIKNIKHAQIKLQFNKFIIILFHAPEMLQHAVVSREYPCSVH